MSRDLPQACRLAARCPRRLPAPAVFATVLFLLGSGAAECAAALATPFVLRCGAPPASAEPADSWGRVLPDQAFNADRDHGFVGGEAVSRLRAAVQGGEPGWQPTFREGSVKYSFRLPRGDYLVRLAFVETDVARPGLRVFDVHAEDEEIISRLDIYAEAGDFQWLVRAVEVSVHDGWLDLRLVAASADRPPRISRIGVERLPAPTTPSPSPPAPLLRGRAGRLQNELWWTPVAAPGVVGYGLFRSATRDGPYQSLTREPIRVTRWTDPRVKAGQTYHYKVRAYDVQGGQSPLSGAVEATPANIGPSSLKTYDILLSADNLRRMSVRRDDRVLVPGEVTLYGSRFLVDVGYVATAERWQARNSLILDMSRDPYRVFRKRKVLELSAEAGDFTQLRERLSSEAARLVGLAAPLVEPVEVLINGRWLGMRYDVERLDRRFRRRAGLESRSGLLARLRRGDQLRSDWEPFGDQVGERGDISALTLLVHQLNRVHEHEIADFFEDHFYVDRLIDRMALAAVRGELDLEPSDLYLLRDPRFLDGKWEILRQEHRRADWGVRDFVPRLVELTADELDRVLFPLSIRAGAPVDRPWMVLFSRFFNVDSFRERYLSRLESMMASELAPAPFDALVDRLFAEVEETLLLEPQLFPFDHGESFLKGPQMLKGAHRRRLASLGARIAEERARPPEPVVISGHSLAAGDGKAWVEIRNRGRAPVALDGYALSHSFSKPGYSFGAARRLGEGEALRLELRSAPEPSGGVLVLWRRAVDGLRVVADFVFHGHSSAGMVYRRRSDATGGWAFFRDADGSDAEPLEPPAYEYSRGVEKDRSGNLTIWFKPARRHKDPRAVAGVKMMYRREGQSEFDAVEMAWDDKQIRYFVGLEADDRRPRTAYYFVATAENGVERVYPLEAPSLTLYLPVLPQIYVNEVCPRPERGAGSIGEFIELHNASEQSVSLRGMYLTDDRDEPTKWRIEEDVSVPPNGYVVFYADGLNRGRHASFKLSNSGEYVGLYGPYEEGNLLIHAMVFRGVPPGQAWGRKQDGTRGFQVWKDPTPGKRNLPKIPDEFLKKKSKQN